MNWTHVNSGVYATDTYRESKANQAMQTLLAGKGLTLKSGDHLSAAELCIEAIARRGADNTTHSSDAGVLNTANLAVNQLKLGNGLHLSQSSHAAGSTCVATIANCGNA